MKLLVRWCARVSTVAAAILLVTAAPAAAQMETTTLRGAGEGDGPHQRLIIRNATMIDGTGAPPAGPVDIVIEGNRIVEVRNVGVPHLPIDEARRPQGATKEIDASGMYVMPGFIDNHVHTGGAPKAPQPEYVYKLWLAHGITATRGVPHGAFEWSLEQKALSARNEIVAPRLFLYQRPGSGEGWTGGPINAAETAREWVRWAAAQEFEGQKIDGLKLGSYDPDIMAALIDEATIHELGTTAHLGQMGVVRMNADDAAKLGLTSMTHFYGLMESLLKDRSLQTYPLEHNNSDEQHRFGQVARLWNQTYEPGSDEWKALIQRWVDLGFIINPTMVIYSAGRDVMRAREAEWHDDYTLPSQWDFYQPSRESHGAYWFDWTTHDEVAWRNFYKRWMAFLNDFKNAGGRVTVGTDCGFIYQTYGFCYVTELEMLQEAGFGPMEVLRAATMHSAQELYEPKNQAIELGIIRPGLFADLVIVEESPVKNLKTLYGTGAVRLNDETREVERIGGVKYTIKDGIVYDAQQLLADVREMVREKQQARAVSQGGN
jgi:imidazolonepropionase-like amidohydrolase